MVQSHKLNKTILVTGSTSRFCKFLKKDLKGYKVFFTSKKNFNILNIKNMEKFVKLKKINYIIHIAGLSRPMSIHDEKIQLSIDLNIIGTANIVKICHKFKIKLIYFSTSYVYPGSKGFYKESSHLMPINNYAWSKLGGEASVQLYKNSLIVRVCMTEKPFVHKKAFANVKTSFAYHDEVVKILFKILNQKGILNVGGKTRIIYEFAKKDNKFVKKSFLKKNSNLGMPFDSSINISKLKKLVRL